MGNARLFRIIRKNDILFLKMRVFRGTLMNYLENLQILPLGHVRLFRRIRKNDTRFLKMCVFFAEFAEIRIFRRNYVTSVKKIPLSLKSN